ncbi:MAG: PAS domain S-box protein, partial [Bacteroidetes bacterium]|nr:PAS domain S-box protein [Bacteroidota bacterium]
MMDKAFLPEKIRNKIKQFESDRANGIPIDKIAFENLFEEILKYSEEQEKNKRDLHEIISEQKDLLNKLSALLDESSEGYVIFDSEFLIRVANKTFADLAGTNTESLINSSILKLISPESQNSFKRHIRQVQKSGRKEDLKLTLEGLTRSREIILDCQSIKQGHSIHIRCKCRDITEKSEAEAELSQTRVKFQNLMEVIRDGVVLLDAECRIVDANLQFCGMTGYTLNELKKTENFFLLSSELTRSWEQEEVWGKLVKDGFTDVYEKEFICRDGQLLTAEFNFNAMQAVKGEPQYFWGIARDISERIRAGKALLDQDERFDAVALFINDWEYWRGVDGKIQYVSPACERITGYSTNEFEQNTNLLEEIVHPDDLETYRKHKILTGRHQSGAEIHSINFRIICRDKSVKWIAHSCQNIRTSDGTYLGIRGSNRDISDKKYIEEDLEQKNRSLSFLNNLALDLAELPFDADLNIYLTKKLKEFTEGIFVSFSEYDKSNGTLVLQHTEIENKLLDKVLQVLNQSKLSINSPVSKEMYDTMIKTIIGIRHSLSQITFGAIPPKPGMIIKSLMNADRFYALVYVVEGELYGTSVIGLRTDQPDPPADFLVSFSHLAAMSLRRRKAELALRESEESIRTTLYSIGDAVISTNKNGNIRQMNPVAEKLTGWTEADAKGMALEEVFNIINEDSREKVENPVHKILREGMVIGLANHTLLLEKNGKEIPIADSGAPILDVNGKIDGVILVFRKQTEDRKAHKALLKEKETASQYFNIAGVIMLVLDRDARIKHINRRGCEILGYEPGEIIGMDWIASFIPAGDKQLISNAFQEIINGKIQINEYLENPVLCRDGEEKLIAWHNAVIRDDDGNITGTISSGDDITIRRQVEEALRESEEKYRSLIENMLDAVIIIGFDGLIQFYNPSVLNLYGGTKEFNPIGQSIGEFLYPESLLSAMTNLVKVKNGEKISAIYQLIKADGKLAWVDTLSTKIQYRGKEGALVILHDITEQKLNEESLRLSEERFAKAFKSNPAAVIITRQADGLIIDVNESYQRMFGYNREELIGQTGIGLNIFDDPDLRNDVISQLQITGAVRNYETKLRSKQGDQLSVLLSVEKIEINRESCLLSIVHDITERKNAEDKLIESEQRYHSFINTHSDLIFVKDENFRYIVVNDALAGFFNKSKEEILFKTDFELRNKETAGLCYTSDKEVTETKARVRLQEKVGDRVFEGIKFPVQLKGGITGVGGIVQDITDRKKAEDKLVESSNRINAILDTMPDMMFIIDNKGTFIEYFSRSKENLGLPPENIIGNNISALFSPEEVKRHLSVYRKALDNGTLETLEYQLTQKGKELYFEAQITPFGTNQVLCIVRNITERKRMEEEIRYHSGMQNLVTRLGNKFINISRNRLDAAVNEAMAEIGEFTHVDP